VHSHPKFQGLLSGLILFIIIAVALTFYSIGLPLPAGLHPDELGKVDQILSGQRNYLHPLLLLHAGSAVNAVLDCTNPVQLLDALRYLTLGCSALALIIVFLLAREFLDGWYRHGVVILVASTPMFAHHAQYFKEDIMMLPWLLGGLWATLIWRRKSSLSWAIAAGMLLGLACASKYIGVLLIIPMVIGFWRDRRSLFVMLFGALCLFLLLMLPALLNSKDALLAIGSEIEHGRVGHWLRLYPWVTFFGFHLTHNLIPGGGWLMIVGGLAGSIWLVFKKEQSHSRWNWIFLSLFGLFWYAVHELSPSKPYVGGIRYVLPLLPIFALCFMGLLNQLIKSNNTWKYASIGRVLLPTLFCFVVLQNGFRTSSSLLPIGPDPRVAITLALAEIPDQVEVVVEGISSLQVQKVRPKTKLLEVGTRLSQGELLTQDLFVTSQYYSERFIRGLELSAQPQVVTERGQAYMALLKHPTLYIEGQPMPMPSYRQCNVTVHALSQRGYELLPVLERKLVTLMPEGSVSLYGVD